MIASVPAKLKTLIDRLTAARATNLDNIDSTTMSRLDVAVSTAVKTRKTQIITSSTTWTRPAGVDSVDYLVVGAGGGGGSIPATANTAAGGGGGAPCCQR